MDSHNRLTLLKLLKPYSGRLLIAFVAAVGEGIADLAGPWPLKIVFDDILKPKDNTNWLNNLVHSMADNDKLAIVKIAALAVMAIALIGATLFLRRKTAHYYSRPMGDARSAPHAVLAHPAHVAGLFTTGTAPAT